MNCLLDIADMAVRYKILHHSTARLLYAPVKFILRFCEYTYFVVELKNSSLEKVLLAIDCCHRILKHF